MERSAEARDSADEMEEALGKAAEVLIDAYLAGDTSAFATL